MLNSVLLQAAAEELATELPYSEAGESRTAAYFVAASLRLEGIASTPESVLHAVVAPYRPEFGQQVVGGRSDAAVPIGAVASAPSASR